MAPPTAGGTSPDKKKMLILAGLGLVIIIVYKTFVLSPPPASPPSPEVLSDNSGIGPVNTSNAEKEDPGMAREEEPIKEKSDISGQFWGRDPFVGDYVETSPGTGTVAVVTKPPVNEESSLVLSGIAWVKNKTAAIINGQIVLEGDLIPVKGKKIYKVLRILKNRVILQDQDKTITLRVRGG